MVVVKSKVRAQIVDVARKIFTRYGFRKTTMDEIAAATRMGKSSIYYYFPGKEEIFKAVVENEAARDLSEKTASPPTHRVSFLVEEAQYMDFCETATEHDLSPSEVARRYCLSGFTFSSVIWETVRRGGTVGDWVRVSGRGPNLAQLALPNFSGKGPAGLL